MIITLHDLNNPTREIKFDHADFSEAMPTNTGTGSLLLRKDSDLATFVHESPSEVEDLVEAANATG